MLNQPPQPSSTKNHLSPNPNCKQQKGREMPSWSSSKMQKLHSQGTFANSLPWNFCAEVAKLWGSHKKVGGLVGLERKSNATKQNKTDSYNLAILLVTFLGWWKRDPLKEGLSDQPNVWG